MIYQDANLCAVRIVSIQAGQSTRLQADNQVNLLAAQNTSTESSTNQSKSGSVGVAMQLGNGGGGMGFTASASKATGQGAGNGVTCGVYLGGKGIDAAVTFGVGKIADAIVTSSVENNKSEK